jgi:phosphopantetheine--protein transferase-like protein
MLLGCGIDSEKIHRFASAARESGRPFPFVFSKTELDHCRSLKNPAQGLCAAFCCKEALRKAISEPCNYTGFEALFDERTDTISLHMEAGVMKDLGIKETRVRMIRNERDADELIVMVSLLGK